MGGQPAGVGTRLENGYCGDATWVRVPHLPPISRFSISPVQRHILGTLPVLWCERRAALAGFLFQSHTYSGDGRGLVAHLPWEQGVAGSNPVSPTNTGQYRLVVQLMSTFVSKTKSAGSNPARPATTRHGLRERAPLCEGGDWRCESFWRDQHAPVVKWLSSLSVEQK